MILTVVCLTIISLSLYFLFRDTLNRLQYIGPIYWITRDNTPKGTPLLSIGFMRQTSFPWKVGKGLQVSISRYSFQFGICKKSKHSDETEGILGALGGRYLDTSTSDIREW
jgi:hypothetical protein